MKNKIILALIFATLSGCGAKDSRPGAPLQSEMPASTNARQSLAAPASDALQSARKLLAYEHSISIDTDEAKAKTLYEKLISACKADEANGCTMLDSTLTSGRNAGARLKMRASAAGIKALSAIVSQGGDVTNQSSKADDLSNAIFDGERRLELLKQYQKKLTNIEQKASSDIDSLIKVSKEIAETQSSIEEISGSNARLMQRVNFDILNIYINTRGGRSFWTPIGDAFGDFSNNLSSAVSAIVTLSAYAIPWLIAMFIFGFIARKLWRRRKK